MTAREVEIALPVELDQEGQIRLAVDFAQELVDRYQTACDVAIHGAAAETPETLTHTS